MDFLSGCAMLVNNQAFRDAGLWDAGLFMYGEEVDWCWRARMAGYRLAAVPSAIMWHKVSASSNYVSSKNRYLRIRNQIWGYRRYGNFLHFLYLVIFTFFRVLYMSIRDLKFGDKNLIISSWKGLAAGWFQEVPPILESMEQ
jgi:GT2 family glycosyltransferase